jgi:hypothetical protein
MFGVEGLHQLTCTFSAIGIVVGLISTVGNVAVVVTFVAKAGKGVGWSHEWWWGG